MAPMDYASELQHIMEQWDDQHLRWFKILEPGTYHFILYDEPDIIKINDNRVMKVPAVYAEDREIYLIGFGQHADPLSPYVGFLAAGYYDELAPGWEFDVTAERHNSYLIKEVPQTKPFVNRLLEEKRQLSDTELQQLLQA